MNPEYDFSNGEQGKFYHPDALFNVPIYLERDVDDFMSNLAAERGLDLEQLVNQWLREAIQSRQRDLV